MDKKRKIFFVIGYLGGLGWGGAHRVVSILANYFSKKGHDVTIIVWRDSSIDYPIDSSVKIKWLHCTIKHKWDIVRPCLMTRSILKKHKGAYLYAFMSRMAVYALFYTLGLDIKIIGSERTDPRTEPHKAIYRLLRNISFCFLYKTVYQTPEAMAYFPKLARKRGCVIPNPITPNLPARFLGVRKKEFVTFCRIDKQKNLQMMIDAFIFAHQKHPDYILRIYGTGLVESEIKEYIKTKNAADYIYLEGFTTNIHTKIVDAYGYLSSSDYEGLSNSMLEALAIGLPSICTDCPIGGANMIIENNVNGILIPVGDSDAMGKQICKLIENPRVCEILSKNAEKIRDLLDEKIICEKWNQLMI